MNRSVSSRGRSATVIGRDRRFFRRMAIFFSKSAKSAVWYAASDWRTSAGLPVFSRARSASSSRRPSSSSASDAELKRSLSPSLNRIRSRVAPSPPPPFIQDQQRGEHREGGSETEEQATPGDEAQLHQTFEVGEDKAVERHHRGGRPCHGSQTRRPGRFLQRTPRGVARRPLFPVTFQQMDLVVDPPSDEDRDKHGGQDVEGADRECNTPRSPEDPRGQAEECSQG